MAPATAPARQSVPAAPHVPSTRKPQPAQLSVGADALLVNERNAARLLCISERKLWEMRIQGLIPHLRMGRAVRYDPTDLKKWINDQKRATAG